MKLYTNEKISISSELGPLRDSVPPECQEDLTECPFLASVFAPPPNGLIGIAFADQVKSEEDATQRFSFLLLTWNFLDSNLCFPSNNTGIGDGSVGHGHPGSLRSPEYESPIKLLWSPLRSDGLWDQLCLRYTRWRSFESGT